MAQPTVKDILDPLATEQALGRSLQARFVEKVAGDANGGSEAKGRKKFWQIFRSKDSSEEGAVPPAPESGQVTVVDLTEFRSFIERDDRAQILADIEVKLLQLSYRAFPLHRPLIREYQDVLNLLARDKTKGIDDRLAELAATRIAISRSTGDATDYLNWYEATQVGRHSGAFAEYKDAVEELRKPPPPRTDPLSEYLDELDKEFGGG